VVKEMKGMIEIMKNTRRIILKGMGKVPQTVTTTKHSIKIECKNNRAIKNN
jgi:hypothetical protein